MRKCGKLSSMDPHSSTFSSSGVSQNATNISQSATRRCSVPIGFPLAVRRLAYFSPRSADSSFPVHLCHFCVCVSFLLRSSGSGKSFLHSRLKLVRKEAFNTHFGPDWQPFHLQILHSGVYYSWNDCPSDDKTCVYSRLICTSTQSTIKFLSCRWITVLLK